MLVLCRNTGQSIIITAPDGTTIEILIGRDPNGQCSQARLCINAPLTYGVDRKEVWERKHKHEYKNPAEYDEGDMEDEE